MFYSIQLDKMRNFRYGMKALKIIEDMTKTTISKLDMENISMQNLAIMLYAGLVHEDKELTVDKVIDLVDEHSDIQTVAEAMGKAMELAFNKEKSEKNLKRAAMK